MERSKKILAAIILTALAVTAAIAQPTTFLGPTVHLGIVKSITDDSAFALGGDVGPKNLRGSGTIGWEFDYNQRMKATAELLRQKLTYSFYDGQQNEWVNQGAIGATYQYDFRQIDPFNTLLDLNAYYAYSPSNNLGTSNVTLNGAPAVVYKRLAGASAYGVGPGISFVSIYGTTAGLELNYDNVHYFTKNIPSYTVSGIGGTLRLAQALTDDVTIGGSAAVRKPYNNYEANIVFGNIDYYGLWSLNAFGAYTVGKSSLPSSYNVGLGADYFIDAGNRSAPPPMRYVKPQKQYKDYKDYKDMPPLVWQEPCKDPELLRWVSIPAVKIPTVLKVPDQKIVQCLGGTPPTFVGPTVDEEIDGFPYTFGTAQYFTGSNLTYSMVAIDNNVPSDSTISIDSATGVITIDSAGIFGADYTITVTATNGCGSATTTSFDAFD